MKNLIILLSCLLFAGSVYGWGQKGHDVTAYIAECHLTPEAAQKIDKVLNGHSPVYYCNWMDIASHTPEYNYTKTWHYLNIDEGQTLETMPRNPKGDVLTAVTALVAELKAGGLAPEAETEKLKMLILEMKAEIAALRSGASMEYPDGVNPRKKAIAAYLREHPDVTNKARIARELHMNRSTVRRYYDEVRAEAQQQM